MLTNHEMDAASPLACLLIGQPTLRRMLRLGVLAALDQRIALRYAMPGMTRPRPPSYITHHLKLGGRSDPLFSDDAITLIHDSQPRAAPAPSTTSPSRPSSPPAPPARPSSTRPAPAPPSPKSRQTDHHRASMNTKAPPAPPRRGLFTSPPPHQQ